MRSIVLLIALFITAHVQANVNCGLGIEKKYTNLKWQKVSKINVYNPFMNTFGLLCLGSNSSNQLERIIFRDSQNHLVDADINALKKGIIIVGYNDISSEARMLLKKANYVSLKLVTTTAQNGANVYNMSLRFLRNLSVSLFQSSSDYRELTFKGVLGPTSLALVQGTDAVDELNMYLSTLPVEFDEVEFLKDGHFIKKTDAYSLKQVTGLL